MKSQTATTTVKFPNRPITIIVPFSAGGGMDLVARALEKTAKNYLGQPLIVVNKPGGTGTIGWNELAGSNPDGYTIGLSGSELFLQPLFSATKYNYSTALEPLAQITATPVVMAVQANQPWQSVDDVVRYAKQHPGQVKYGHNGVGSLPHIVGEIFSKTTDITMAQVPFQGAAENITALLGGHIQLALLNPASVKEYVKSGMIKILAVTSEQHLTDPVLAATPTFKELGWEIIYDYRIGIAVPKETPVEVKAQLAEGLQAMITDPQFKKNIENLGLQYEYLDSKATVVQWLEENQKLSQVVQDTGILDRIKAQKK